MTSFGTVSGRARTRVLAAAVAAAVGVAVTAALAAGPASAQTGSTGGQTGITTPTLPGETTTTTVPVATTPSPTTVPAAPTTTSTVPAGHKTSPGAGVPSVPVGGPATTTPKPGSHPSAPAPPNPQPVLTEVQNDLDQLSAIDDYQPAQAAVAAAQRAVTASGSGLLSAQSAVHVAGQGEQAAQGGVGAADDQLRNLAIAAYIGVAYPTVGAQPPSLGALGPGTVATPGGLTGVDAMDADEMLRVVADQAKHDVASADSKYQMARKTLAKAQFAYNQARQAVTGAEADLLASQQNLKVVTEAATTPGAASASDLPQANLTAQLNEGTSPGVNVPGAPSPSILGKSIMTGAELADWFASAGHKANITVPIAQLANDYQAAGRATGVRYDVAFAQSVVETGFFSFPSYGQLTPKDNNFAGIGACDSCAHGWSFPNAQTGAGAQLELLEAYATPHPVPTPLLGSKVGVGGCCTTWMALAGHWASSLTYGISIMTIYNEMLTWVIPQRLLASGLIAPTAAQARGPELAPLPGSKPAAKSSGSTPSRAKPAGVIRAARI